MVTYHQGNRKRVESDLINFYIFRDIISKNYDSVEPEVQKSIIDIFNYTHRRMCKKIGREVIDEEDARNALQEYFGGMHEKQLRAINLSILGPKSKSRKLKEKARRNMGDAKQLNLFGK